MISGLTIADLKAGRLPEPSAGSAFGDGLAGEEAAFPTNVKPMMAHLADEPFSHSDWLFEPKLDGFRAVALVRHGKVTLLSRTGNDLTDHFREVVDELSAQPEEEMVLDGELVALDENGLPNFGLMQQSVGLPKHIRVAAPDGPAKVVYYPFDLLYANGRDLQRVPLFQRKALLAQVLVPGESVQLMEYVEEQGESFFAGATQMGLEGMVAKRRDSIYEPAARSGSWAENQACEVAGVCGRRLYGGGPEPGQPLLEPCCSATTRATCCDMLAGSAAASTRPHWTSFVASWTACLPIARRSQMR